MESEASVAVWEKDVLRTRDRVGAHDAPAAFAPAVQHETAALLSRAARFGIIVAQPVVLRC